MNQQILFLIVLTFLIIICVFAYAMKNKLFLKMTIRNIKRRKTQSALVISGLLIGTAIISGSLVTGDTLAYLFKLGTYERLDLIDETITKGGGFGTYEYYDYSVFAQLNENLSKDGNIDGISPLIVETLPVVDLRTQIPEPKAQIVGFNATLDKSFGTFKLTNGEETYGNDLNKNEVIINQKLADNIEAREGDSVLIYYTILGLNQTTFQPELIPLNFTYKIKYIAKDEGKGNFLGSANVFVNLENFAEKIGKKNKINYIKISNKGNRENGIGYSDEVASDTEKILNEILKMKDANIQVINYGDSVIVFSEFIYLDKEFQDDLAKNTTYVKGADNYLISQFLMIKEQNISGFNSSNNFIPMFIPLNISGFNSSNNVLGNFILIDNTTTDGYLKENEILITENFALIHNYKVGDNITINYISGFGFKQTNLTVKYIVKPIGYKGMFLSSYNATLVSMETMQKLLQTNGVNTIILIADEGKASEVKTQIDSKIDEKITLSFLNIEVKKVKQDAIKISEEGATAISQIFIILGVFGIVAGIMLIINIFVMLAEERKQESGMARAVGMKRRHLMQLFLYEGTIYSIIASLIGTFLGLLVGYLIIFGFGLIFAQGNLGNMPFHYENESLIIAFCLGLLITFSTVVIASWRVSKLNIICAIRDIPEEKITKSPKRLVILGIVSAIFGVLFFFGGINAKTLSLVILGPSLIFLGFGLILMKYKSPRLSLTVAGILILIWNVIPNKEKMFPGITGGFEMLIVSGLLLVLAGLLIVMSNSDIMLNILIKIFGRRKSLVPILKTALSYPMQKKFRTAMTLAMFSLVIFTITITSMFANLQSENIEGEYIQQSGGYDVVAETNQNTPIADLSKEINSKENLTGKISDINSLSVGYAKSYGYKNGEEVERYVEIVGVGNDFIDENNFTFFKVSNEYEKFLDKDKRNPEIWKKLKENSSLIVVDGSFIKQDYGPSFGAFFLNPDETVVITNAKGENKTYKVIGVLHAFGYITYSGIFMTKENAINDFNIKADTLHLIKIKNSNEDVYIEKQLKKEFIKNGMSAVSIRQSLKEGMKMFSQILNLMDAYLSLGLVVGIAGLGVITVRSVVERRQEIGMMKAIGFQNNMVLKSFLIEISFVALLGIALGIILGILSSYDMWASYYEGKVPFTVPWITLLLICGIAYVFCLVFTISPSLKASKIPPAEALRYVG